MGVRKCELNNESDVYDEISSVVPVDTFFAFPIAPIAFDAVAEAALGCFLLSLVSDVVDENEEEVEVDDRRSPLDVLFLDGETDRDFLCCCLVIDSCSKNTSSSKLSLSRHGPF